MKVEIPADLQAVAEQIFGDRLGLAERFATHLATTGVERGLIGPREVPRLWERHILNCGIAESAFLADAKIADVGSGAGLPGIALAIARPDLHVTLIEPMERRTIWANEVIADLGLSSTVLRARAEEVHGVQEFDQVTARAVAALDKLARWTLPLVKNGGTLVALKGSSVEDELAAATKVLRKLHAVDPVISFVGEGLLPVPTTLLQLTVRR